MPPDKLRTKHRYLERTTIHGIRDLVTANSRGSTLFWITVLLACCGVLMFNISKMALDFHHSPMVTTVRTGFVDHFPPMMYCPYGIAASAERMQHYQLTDDDLIFLNDYLMDSHTMSEDLQYKSDSSAYSYQRLLAKLFQHNITLSDLLLDLTLSFNIKGVYTNVDGVQGFYDQVESTPVVNAYGICHRLDFTAVARSGNFPVFVILTFETMQKVMPGRLQEHYTYGIMFLGESVYSFNPVMPNYIRDGMKNYVELKETKTMYRNSRRDPCDGEKSSEMARRVYSCYRETTVSQANCTYLDSLNSTEFNISIEYTCHQSYHHRLSRTTDEFAQCVKSHIKEYIPCSQTLYETVISSLPHRSNTTDVWIQYRFPLILMIEEHEMYTWQVFISNIGGLISLLCGASVISITQLAYLLCKASMKAARARKRNNSNRHERRNCVKR